MWNRMFRFAVRLTAMEPRTEAGLAAKAAAGVALEAIADDLDWSRALMTSVGRGALRIIGAACDARAERDRQADGQLLDLIARHGPLHEQDRAANAAFDRAQEAWMAAWPPAPPALTFRPGDLGGELGILLVDRDDDGALRYGQRAVTQFLALPPLKRIAGKGAEGRKILDVDPDAEARRAEILAAWETWAAEKEALKDRTGLTAAGEAERATSERLKPVEDGILDTAPRTFAGLQAKARWIEAVLRPDGTDASGEYAEVVLNDILAMPAATPLPVGGARPEPIVAELRRASELRARIEGVLPDRESDDARDRMTDHITRPAGMPVSTPAGAVAVLEWVREEFVHAHVMNGEPDHLDVVSLGFIDRALGVLRGMVLPVDRSERPADRASAARAPAPSS